MKPRPFRGDIYGRFTQDQPWLSPKVFEANEFIEGIGRLRGIAEHVETGNVTLRDVHNRPYTITSASSAALVFKAPVVNLTDTTGVVHRLDHIEYLTKADRHIKRAFQRANESG